MHKINFKKNGFLITELIVVIAVIAILSTVVLMSINSARMKGRDVDRVTGLREINGALALYYIDNKKYPDPSPASNSALNGFAYRGVSGGVCTATSASLYFDDTNDADGLLNTLVTNKYLSKQWSQPSTPTDQKFLCRYAVPNGEVGNVQHYLLHCNLENDANDEKSDGGLNDTVYEIYSPGVPQFCLAGTDGRS